MRTLKLFEHVSLDGVIQHSDDGDGFPHADWTAPYRSPEGMAVVLAAQGERFDLVLGRRTYDLWSGYWPDAPPGPMADPINAATKHVATHRADSLRWGPCEALGPDPARGVARLKAQDGPDLVAWGSSTLVAPLLERGLVDEVVLLTYPLVLGTGKRLFADGVQACAFEQVATQPLSSGIVVNRYRAKASTAP